jgi:hypothetical protein
MVSNKMAIATRRVEQRCIWQEWSVTGYGKSEVEDMYSAATKPSQPWIRITDPQGRRQWIVSLLSPIDK